MEWKRICDELNKATKERLQALESLQVFISKNVLDKTQTCEFAELSANLLEDNNYKVCQQTLETLSTLVQRDPDALKVYFKFLVHHAAEKLGDTKQSVRQAACDVLLALCHAYKPDSVIEKVSRFFSHKSWRVRHGVIQLFAESISKHGLERTEANINYVMSVIRLVEDSDNTVRDAAAECLEELYRIWGEPLRDLLERSLRPATLSGIYDRLQKAGLLDDAVATSSASSSMYDPDNDTITLSNSIIKRRDMPAASAQEDNKGPADQGRAVKRGGYKDGGGVTANGSLPEAAPITLSSDRELRAEMEKFQVELNLNTQWNLRVDAMIKLEGLAKGCSNSPDLLVELLKPLTDLLVLQINDRRSAVARQACHLLGCLAEVLGVQFEPFALQFLPMLFKVAIITIQVMAEAADACSRAIIRHCESSRLVPVISDAILTERNPKVRIICSSFLLQVLESWPAETYQRCTDQIESALTKALRDASPEARKNARGGYAAYARNCPGQAEAFYKRSGRDLQDKMDEATRSQDQGERSSGGSLSSASSRPASSLARVPSGRLKSFSRSSSMSNASDSIDIKVPARMRAERAEPTIEIVERPPRMMRNGSHGPKAPAAHDSGIDPTESTVLTASVNSSAVKANGNSLMKNANRVPVSAAQTPKLVTLPTRTPVIEYRGAPSVSSPSSTILPASTTTSGDYNDYQHQPRMHVNPHKLVTNLLEAKSWNVKVEILTNLRDMLRNNAYGDPSDLARELERVQPRLMECVEDAHFKVVQAALETLSAALSTAPRLFEPNMDRILPTLFMKTIDAKKVICSVATEALQVCAERCSADILLVGLVRAVDNMKVPKSRVAVLEYACSAVGSHAPAGTPTSTMYLRQWVTKVIPILSDKNAEVRRWAVQAIQTAYTNVDPAVVTTVTANATGADAAAARKALAPVAPDIEASSWGRSNSASSSMELQTPVASRRASLHTDSTRTPMATASTRDIEPRMEPRYAALLLRSQSTNNASPVAPVPPTNSFHASPYDRKLSDYTNSAAAAVEVSSPQNSRGSDSLSTPTHGPPSTPLHSTIPAATTTLTPMTVARQQTRYLAAFTPSASTPQDPLQQSRRLVLVLRDLQKSPSDELMAQLLDSVKAFGDNVWEGHVAEAVRLVAHAATDDTITDKEVPARILLDLVRHHTPLLDTPVLDKLLTSCLVYCGDGARETMMSANEALVAAASSAPPAHLLDFLQRRLPAPANLDAGTAADGEALVSVLKALEHVVKRLPPQQLSLRVDPELLPGLQHALSHPRTDVRKAVVFCIVQMWATLGERLTPHLESLNMAQRKLITYYFSKRADHGNGRDQR